MMSQPHHRTKSKYFTCITLATLIILSSVGCTSENQTQSSDATDGVSCVTDASLSQQQVADLSRRFSDPDSPDIAAAAVFVGLCETTATGLGDRLGVVVFVLQRDGDHVGDPTDSFTNTVGLIVEQGQVIEAVHG